MSVTTFRSTDSGAFALDGGGTNTLIALLRGCLVGSGTAYGSLPKKGWAEVFTGTDKAVFRTVDGVAYLSVVTGTATGTASYRECIVRGAEGATDVDTLIDPFPTVAEVANTNARWRVSNTLDSTTRPWVLVADDDWLMLSIEHNTGAADFYIFGKYSRARSANSWPYIINTRNIENLNNEGRAAGCSQAAYVGTGGTFLHAMRSPDGVIKSPRASLVTESSSSTTSHTLPGVNGPPIPNADGLIFMSPPQVWINSGAGATLSSPTSCGFFPNLWSPMHNFGAAGRAVVFGDVFNASGYDPSAQFMFLGPKTDASGKWIVELTDTWQDPLA